MVVLILESEAIVGLMLETELRDAGYTVLGPVTTVDDALAVARRQWIDCALLSVQTNGARTADLQIADLVATLAKELSVPAWIICNDTDQARHARTHAIGCIKKPYAIETVVQALNVTHEILSLQHPHPTRLPSGLELFWHSAQSFRARRADDSAHMHTGARQSMLGRGRL